MDFCDKIDISTTVGRRHFLIIPEMFFADIPVHKLKVWNILLECASLLAEVRKNHVGREYTNVFSDYTVHLSVWMNSETLVCIIVMIVLVKFWTALKYYNMRCLLYTSDAADE